MMFATFGVMLFRFRFHFRTAWIDPTVYFYFPTQRQTNLHRTQWESVLMSVSVQYEHLHIILCKSICIGLGSQAV